MDKNVWMKYRNDIDGLRAIAVLAVLFFHLGYLPNGYLGVDVFFVISGYLITGIIYKQVLQNNFSILKFYIKRTRRIIPLVLFIILISLVVGLIVMLPDDLENLAQSIIATNFFGNNILQAITTKNYWDVVNEYKPLMHTWSLAVEEQYYLIYPIIFLVFKKERIKYILPTLIFLTILSLVLFFSPFDVAEKFYYLPFRFFELSLGGICAITLKGKLIQSRHSFISIILLIILLTVDLGISNELLILITVIITCVILMSSNENSKITSFFLENKVVVFIGKISFSLYMWHQLLFAYARYFVVQDITLEISSVLIIMTFMLSVVSYYVIEQVFRDKTRLSNKSTFIILLIGFVLTSSISFFICKKAGVVRDVPELGLYKNEKRIHGVHSQYNHKNYLLDKDFKSKNKIKVLVIGDSFARDWINILLESEIKGDIEISYIYNIKTHKNLEARVENAEIIYCSRFNINILDIYNLPREKTWCVGTKNFGVNNGIFYNSKKGNYCKQRTSILSEYLVLNKEMKKEWNDHYIDLLSMVLNSENTVPVFTDDCMFISQDCRHLTKSGAIYFSKIIKNNQRYIFDQIITNNK